MSVSARDLAAAERLLVERLEEVNRRAVGRRWRPRRLILINWWLFDEQVFHFAQGRLVLHGRNASGKSTVLAAAITLVLDGDKSPERIDTFGGRGRSVRYYLVGDPEATPDSSFYHDGRTGYVALEFQQGGSGRTLTIGVGLYTHRSRAGGEIDFWGFSIEDGRRIGYDIHVYDEQRVPLTPRMLADRIGAGGRVVRSVAEYKHLVNHLLFGFPEAADYDDLLSLLLQLRSPKLNKDVTPSEVCESLLRALAPLDAGLLDQVSSTIEAIDDCQDRLAETDEQARAARTVDAALAEYGNQLAQEAAVKLRAAQVDRERAERRRSEIERQLETERERHGVRLALQGRVERALAAVEEELRTLQADPAFHAEEELARAREDLDRARLRRDETRGALQRKVQDVDRLDARAREAVADWLEQRAGLLGLLADAAGHARDAAWTAAEEAVEHLARALEALPAPEADEHADGAPGTAAPDVPDLRAEGSSRREAIRAVAAARKAVAAAEREREKHAALLEQAREAFRQAVDAVHAAARRLDALREGAAAALHAWREQARRASVPDHVLAAAVRAIRQCPDGELDLDGLREPLLEWIDREIEAVEEAIARLREERADPVRRARELDEEIRRLRGQRDIPPERSPAAERARARLREAGIPAYPLYAVCDFAPDVPEAEQAAIERALTEAGLLDALVIPRTRIGEVPALLADPELADRWIEPRPLPLGYTLADKLRPALPPETDALTPADVAEALRSIAWGEATQGTAVDPSGSWRLDVLTGAVDLPAEARPRYIGEGNRRAYRHRRLEELTARRAAVQAEIDRIDRDIAERAAERESLAADRRALERLPLWNDLRGAAEARRAAERVRSQAEERLRAEEQAEAEARARLDEASRHYLHTLERVPEARGRDEDGLHALLQATDAVLRDLQQAAGGIRNLTRLAAEIRHRWDEHHRALADAERLRRRLAEDEAEVARKEARCRVLDEQLRAMGIEELRARIRRLAGRRDRLRRAERRLAAALAARGERLRHQEDALREADATLARARELEAQWRDELRHRLLAHPSLGDALALLDDGPDGPARAAAHLLRLRRAEERDLERYVEEDRRRAFNQLSAVFQQERVTLAPYAPELDEVNGQVTFREQGRVLRPHELVAQLEERRRFEQLLLEQEERKLYEDVILRRLANEIRRQIARTEQWVMDVNRLLEQRPLHGDEILSLDWRPRTRDRSGTGTGNLQRLVELIRRDAETLTRDEVEELIGHFRDNVNRIREQERGNVLTEGFRAALERVLDYREWFDFVLRTRRRGEPVRDLTDQRFASRSGAEKSLAVFVPLLAAAHARYQKARSDAPRLVGLDEAFAGVDEGNIQVMFRLMVELDFSWIMTSEKLRGEGAALPACATYTMVTGDGLVVPVLSVWDGERRLDALDAVDAGEVPVAAGGPGQDDARRAE